ncbi:hypothetical protein [Streptomyces sp. NPDC001422]|uniref:hypothetical protein n=1 Tax=Streptomyces sp. NPDC001422 TaxID=3364575 RepID=UPI0036B8DA5D
MTEPITNLADAVAALGALPMSTGQERLSSAERESILSMIGDAKPARSSLLLSFGKSVHDRAQHEHPKWEDLYCMNLSSYMGERIAPVLRRLVDGEAENARLRARVAELEAARKADHETWQHDLATARAEREAWAAGKDQPAPMITASAGACDGCGMAPERWCPGCAKCACVTEHDKGCMRVGA